MPRTRSQTDTAPAKAGPLTREILGINAQRKQEAAKKKMLAHFKMAVTKKHTVGSIKLGKKTGGKTRRRK